MATQILARGAAHGSCWPKAAMWPGRKATGQALAPRNQALGSQCPLGMEQLPPPWECLLLGRQSQGPGGPGMCLYDSILG